MKKFIVAGVALAAVLGLSACENNTYVTADSMATAKIELSAYNSKKFEANQFIVGLSLELHDGDKDKVYKKLEERRAKIFEVAKSLEIDESNVEQNSVSLTKEWNWYSGKRTLKGYRAAQRFDIKIDSRRDAAMLTQILSSEPDVEIYPTQSTLKNTDSLQGLIIEEAVKSGMDKASHYAAGAGRKLGQVLYIGGEGEGVTNMGGMGHRYKVLMANSMDGVAGGIDESSIADSVEISATVRLSIELK